MSNCATSCAVSTSSDKTYIPLRKWLLILLMVLSAGIACAQGVYREHTHQHGTHTINSEQISHRDSIRLFEKPDALRAVWMGAIIPGYGQIHNRSYWKLPIVYGAFMGCTYAILWTNGQYEDYKTAYRDIYTDIRSGQVSESPDKSYIAILPNGYTLDRVGGAGQWQNTLQNQQNTFRRYRDISIVATIAVYALSLVDAYVDAQLFDFDISPDLSVNRIPGINPMAPDMLQSQSVMATCHQAAGLKVSIKF